MWIERFVIVVTSLNRDFLPSAWYTYAGTLWDWATLFGCVGLFFFGFLVSIRFIPMLAVAEMRELVHNHSSRKPEPEASR